MAGRFIARLECDRGKIVIYFLGQSVKISLYYNVILYVIFIIIIYNFFIL